jgi:hypothetical protein
MRNSVRIFCTPRPPVVWLVCTEGLTVVRNTFNRGRKFLLARCGALRFLCTQRRSEGTILPDVWYTVLSDGKNHFAEVRPRIRLGYVATTNALG